MTNKAKKNSFIELLRFIFTTLVIVAHYKISFPDNALPGRFNGHIGVEFFFILSGFLMAAHCVRHSSTLLPPSDKAVWNYIKRKCLSIAPVYYLTLSFFVVRYFVVRNIGFELLAENLARMLPSFLFLNALGLSEIISIPYSWYISNMMMATLLLFPIVYCWKKKFNRIIAPLIVIVYCTWAMQTYGKLFMLQSDWLGICFPSFIRAVGDMCMGVISFEICESLKNSLQGRLTWFGEAFLTLVNLAMFVIPIYWIVTGLRGDLHPCVLLMFAVGVAISFSGLDLTASITNVSWFSSLCSYLGKISLSLYLGQGIAVNYFPETFARGIRGGVLYFAACFVVSLLIYFGSKCAVYLLSKLYNAFLHLCLKPKIIKSET